MDGAAVGLWHQTPEGTADWHDNRIVGAEKGQLYKHAPATSATRHNVFVDCERAIQLMPQTASNPPMMVGNVTGSPLAGVVYDTLGSYQAAWLSFAAVALPGELSHPVERTYHTELYETLLDPIEKHMPVFELLNRKDFTKTPTVGRITCEGDWRTAFRHYASSASLLVFYADALTPGIEAEMRWAKKARREDTVFVLVTDHARRQLKENDLELANTWTIPEMRSQLQIVKVPEGLLFRLANK